MGTVFLETFKNGLQSDEDFIQFLFRQYDPPCEGGVKTTTSVSLEVREFLNEEPLRSGISGRSRTNRIVHDIVGSVAARDE